MVAPADIEERPYADLVFHVLAHLPSHVPASLYDPRYVAYCEKHLGPATERALGDDLRALSRIANDHERYARLQALAWLFPTPDDGTRHATRELSELSPGDVADPTLLGELQRLGPEADVLRDAAELEREHHEKLPAGAADLTALEHELSRARLAAPELGSFRIGLVRALVLRGRVRRSEIWVGVPGFELGPPARHAAWQAAHEATVAELFRAAPDSPSDRPIEHAALVLLAGRAALAGLAGEHAVWLSHFGSSLPALDAAALNEPLRTLVSERLSSASRDETRDLADVVRERAE